ncbi:unnamed protein product [Acanthoscelides obtectus]|uniref:Uncharacterized protein n=1 Tax=Acanthoscelides obtectus TaxID=200917 RepID=A0A9P0P8D1_ACAOB|nr:unnamed protein product [Acanthoscelides obtectus]CAK1677160.1 hypothetical protein AOBTE_LOCUS31148 [Acanthoscelides obtectus]
MVEQLEVLHFSLKSQELLKKDRPGKTSEEEAPQAGSSQDNTSLPKPIQHGMTDPVLSQFQLSKYQESQAGPSQAESSSTAKLQTEKSQTKPTLSSIEIKKADITNYNS